MPRSTMDRRTFLKLSGGAAAAAVLGPAVTDVFAADAAPADLVFRNGPIVTVSDKFAVAEALAVRGNSILAVGGDKEVSKHIGAGTKVVDLKGRSVSPGLIDAHSHPIAFGHMETRFVINDACAKAGKPWVYVGAVATYGMRALLDPKKGACLRCFLPNAPRAGSVPTCATAGVLNTVPGIMGAMAATEAIRFLTGRKISGKLVMYDAWSGEYHTVTLAKRHDCPTCVKRTFEFLEAPVQRTKVNILCGHDSVQITPPREASLDLDRMASTLKEMGDVTVHPAWLIFLTDGFRITVFKNGRVLISGTNDEKTARALYSKYIGN
jgi:adenylyltransferase/sulfurtransferase